MLDPRVIFADDAILVLDKPSGWITNTANTTTDQPTIQAWLKSSLKYPISSIDDLRSGVVHRLDKETSGILVVAKTKEAFETLQKEFKDRVVKKTYLALVHGQLEPSAGKISAPVGRLPWNRRRFGVLPGGREAVTNYATVKTFEKFTLLELTPETGRTHQIRIHLKHIGHPVVADEFYAGRKTSRDDRLWCPRLFLHAQTIAFMHPQTGEVVTFSSPLPEDLKKVVLSLSK